MSRSPVTALAVVLPLLVTACGTQALEGERSRSAPSSSVSTGRWTTLPDVPLSPREGAATAHVTTDDGTDLAIVLGGYTGPPCPPNADCAIPEDAMAADGAALDLTTGSWREIAEAPRPVGWYSSTAVLGDTVFVMADGRLLAWDAGDDAWSEVAPPEDQPEPGGGGAGTGLQGTLVADPYSRPARLLVTSGSDELGVRPDLVLDPTTGSWTRLPADPLEPSFDRQVLPTPLGLVLVAKPIAADGGPENPALVRAAVLAPGAATWRTIESGGDQLGGWAWAWTGDRLVDATPGGADGGEVNGFGRTIAYGGALDPATGEWQALDGTPEDFTGGWPVEAVSSRFQAVQGWIYDDGDAGLGSSWTRVPVPDGAPEDPGSAVWVDDVLVVVGGADWDGYDGSPQDVRSTGTWTYQAG